MCGRGRHCVRTKSKHVNETPNSTRKLLPWVLGANELLWQEKSGQFPRQCVQIRSQCSVCGKLDPEVKLERTMLTSIDVLKMNFERTTTQLSKVMVSSNSAIRCPQIAVDTCCQVKLSTFLFCSLCSIGVLVLLSVEIRSCQCVLISEPLLYLCSKLSTIRRDFESNSSPLWFFLYIFGKHFVHPFIIFAKCVMFATHYIELSRVSLRPPIYAHSRSTANHQKDPTLGTWEKISRVVPLNGALTLK